ncbi:MAG: hydroxyacylglutathione hydrolase [Myxococcota bacterium]
MHVVTVLPAPVAIANGALEVLTVPNGQDNLVWLIVHRPSGRAAVVDGIDAAAALATCEREGLALTTVLNTHTHGDHIGINKDLARLGRLADLRVVGPRKAAADVPGLTEPVAGGDTVELFGATCRVIDCEGHIDGHVAYAFDDAVFCGDALFTGGAGRMFVGPPEVYQAGLARLRALPDATLVFCAHEYTADNLRFALSLEPGNARLQQRVEAVAAVRATGRPAVPSTLGEERLTNPFLRWDVPELAAEVRRQSGRDDLDSAVALVAATRALKDSGAYRRPPAT